MSCDIIMGNVAPLHELLRQIAVEALNGANTRRIVELAESKILLDKSEKEVRTKVRGTELVEGEGPMGYYGDV